MKYIWWFIKCALGFGSVEDGSICWFSKKFYNVHDYWTSKGGDGDPDHFFVYTCHECGSKFKI